MNANVQTAQLAPLSEHEMEMVGGGDSTTATVRVTTTATIQVSTGTLRVK